FEAQNNLFFTNAPSTSPTSGGYMFGNPGYRFMYNSGSGRHWMDTWTNNGTISTDNSLIFSSVVGSAFGSAFSVFFGFNSTPSILLVQSTNIASTGTGTLRA